MSEEHLFHFLFSLLKKNQHKSEQILIFFLRQKWKPCQGFWNYVPNLEQGILLILDIAYMQLQLAFVNTFTMCYYS